MLALSLPWWGVAAILAGSVMCTVFVTVVLLNFSTGERKIKAPVKSQYRVRDPDFMQSLGNLLEEIEGQAIQTRPPCH